jgi:trans-aconitate methyltransferase
MPDNIHELSHALMRMVAADGPWANRLVPIAKTRALIGPLDEYYGRLKHEVQHRVILSVGVLYGQGIQAVIC